MTPAELAEIKVLLAAILPAPWYVDNEGSVWSARSVKPTPESNLLSRVCDATARWAFHDPTHETTIRANLDFIAQARTWIPQLVAEVERLKTHETAR